MISSHFCYAKAELPAYHSLKSYDDLRFSSHLQGVLLYMKNHYRDAFDVLSKAHQLSPKRTDTVLFLSRTLVALEKQEEALKVLDDLLQLKPEKDQILREKGMVLFGMKKYEAVLPFFDKFLEVRRKSATLIKIRNIRMILK